MWRKICCAIFALLISSGAVFPQARVAPRPPVRVIAVHRFHPRYFFPYAVPAQYAYPVPYAVPYPATDFIPTSPTYVFVDSSSPSHPQLVFKDGTTYTVADYWRVDDQLHFTTVEEGGTKSVPHSVPFADLNVQKTTDADAAQGFRFVVRDKPIQQWLEDRAQHGSLGNRGTGTLATAVGYDCELSVNRYWLAGGAKVGWITEPSALNVGGMSFRSSQT